MWYSFQGSTLNVLLRDPLERIFSFFLSLSAIPRELIQHSDFRLWVITHPTVCRKEGSHIISFSKTSPCKGGPPPRPSARDLGSATPVDHRCRLDRGWARPGTQRD